MDNVPPPKWLNLPEYAGWLVGLNGDNLSYAIVRNEIGEELFKPYDKT